MDTGQIDTAHLEDEMRRTRARIDAKLDELNLRMAAAKRSSGPWAIGVLVALSTAATLWFRRRKPQGLPRYSGIPRYGEAQVRLR